MPFKLKKFQIRSVNELLQKTTKLLQNKERKLQEILFVAPTGCGKTIMLSYFVKEFFQKQEAFIDNKKPFTFVWLTPGKGGLHNQSYNKIHEVLNYSNVNVLSSEEVFQKNYLLPETINVLNWEKVTKKTNTIHNDSEFFNFKQFLHRTKSFCQVIAIVDEEHYGKTPKSLEVLEYFNAKVVIRASATPKPSKQQHFEIVKVWQQEVVDAQLIKKRYLLNDRLPTKETIIIDDELGENKILLQFAVDKQKELLELYQKDESIVNPLIIVQLPDEKGEYQKKIRENTEKFFLRQQINYENKLLAINLDKEKRNLESLKKINNHTIVIITKQTITHGWDCPRAQILVKLRGNSSKTFNIQTLGRISRMPEVEKGHYQNESLNQGYVFTWDESIFAKNPSSNENNCIYRNFETYLKKKWFVELDHIIPNQKQQTSLADSTKTQNDNYFALQFNKWFRKSKMGIENTSVDDKKMQTVMESFSKFKPEVEIKYESGFIEGDWHDKKSETKIIVLSYSKDGLTSLENKFQFWVCYPLANKLGNKSWVTIYSILEFLFTYNPQNPLDKTKSKKDFIYNFGFHQNSDMTNELSLEARKLKEAIFYCFLLNSREKWFDLFTEFYKLEKKQEHQKIKQILHKSYLQNFSLFEKKVYKFKVDQNSLQENDFDFMPKKNNNLYQRLPRPDTRNFSQPEREFIHQFLESNAYGGQIEWWYRNEENNSDSWKVLYLTETNELRNFYPDFILKIKGKIWIIEIKDTSGLDQNNQNKFWYLQQFCRYHELNFAFVFVNKDTKRLKFNNEKWSSDFESPYLRDINDIFNQ